MNAKSINSCLTKIYAATCVIMLIGLVIVASSQILFWIYKRQGFTFVDLLQNICICVFMAGVVVSIIIRISPGRSVEATDTELIQHRYLMPDIVIHWNNVLEVIVTSAAIKIISNKKDRNRKINISHRLYDANQRKETIEFIMQHVPPNALHKESDL